MTTPIGTTRIARSEPLATSVGSEAQATPTRSAEPDYQRVFEANTRLPDLRHLLESSVRPGAASGVAAPLELHTTSSPTIATLDEIERRFAGSYRVPGRDQPIPARAMFHSSHPQNTQLDGKGNAALHMLAQRACSTPILGGALRACMHARPTPEQLTMVTQALIDAGHLGGAGPHGSQDIRLMQKRFCIGIDCIGYVRACQLPLVCPGFDRTRKQETFFVDILRANGRYDERPDGLRGVALARPGDILHLARKGTDENREHNVVVRQHETLTPGDPRWGSLVSGAAKLGGGGAQLRAGDGPVHLLEVVQCGGGPDDIRGVRRELWLYNESSGAWGALDRVTKELTLFARGPQEHPTGTVFAPRKVVR
ncbi:MAG: hypothetical protein EOP08_03225 [Proteobacteria bacterium]|nr:MAG: hypothetical protein EOP08_03225 [Pseudomonadota bacterium]